MMKLKPHLILISIAVLYVLIQLGAVTAPFVPVDDREEFSFIQGFHSWLESFRYDSFGYFRPVKNLLFILFNFMGGPRHLIWPMRLTAIVLGALTIPPVYFCLRRILPSSRQAVLAVGIWILAPTMVSCTAWLSCLNIQIMAALACLAILAHDCGRTVLAAALFFLASVCYEGGLATLALLVAFDFFLRPERFKSRRQWVSYGAYFAVALLYLGLHILTNAPHAFYSSFGAATTRLQTSFTAAWFTWVHLRNWLFPFNRFAIMNTYCWGDVAVPILSLCWGILLAGVAAAFACRRRYPVPAYGIAWFLLAFAPMSNLLGFKNGPYGDYYLALASVGLAMVTAWLIAFLLSCRRRAWAIVAIGLIALRGAGAIESASWASYWNDARVMFAKSVGTFPDSFLWRLQIAKVACDAGKDDIAWKRVHEVYDAHPDAIGCYPILATLEFRRNNYEASQAFIKRFLGYVPNDVNALVLAAKLQEKGFHRPAEAERLYRQALRMPACADTPSAAQGLADLLARQKAGNK